MDADGPSYYFLNLCFGEESTETGVVVIPPQFRCCTVATDNFGLTIVVSMTISEALVTAAFVLNKLLPLYVGVQLQELSAEAQ